ncbi:MAG TPA: Gfo/Idh/MocA family oxidoreductase [Phycisphaerae bacterium]|nr:Gfo/Idh/MocA family oxidoreductase [Phycisphaerae bacterium]
MQKKLQVGILGAGSMGRNHGQQLKSLEDVEITGICSLPLQTADDLAALLEIDCPTCDSFETMLSEVPMDALYLCIPPFAHDGQVEAAAAKGIHMFLEKPIALDLARAESMALAVETAGVITQVGYHMRFQQSVQRFQSMLADGSAGKPVQFQGRYWCNIDPSGWWRDKTKSGGQITEQLTHIYDMACYLMGDPKTAIGWMANLAHTDNPEYTVEDTSVGMLRFDNGSIASISGSNTSAPMHFFGEYRICCENVTMEYRTTGQPWVTPDSATIYLGEEEKEEFVEDKNLYLEETLDFLSAIRENRPALTPIENGVRAIRAVEAVIKSAEQDGKAMIID